jgi:hypothetical protein
MCAGKLFGTLIKLLLIVPPLYLVARYIRWSMKQSSEAQESSF